MDGEKYFYDELLKVTEGHILIKLSNYFSSDLFPQITKDHPCTTTAPPRLLHPGKANVVRRPFASTIGPPTPHVPYHRRGKKPHYPANPPTPPPFMVLHTCCFRKYPEAPELSWPQSYQGFRIPSKLASRSPMI